MYDSMAQFTGLRVLRGPDWNSGDIDGGEGYLGTVTQLLGNHEVRVLWDMGEENTCRTGKDGNFDLRVFDSSAAGIRHTGTLCEQCREEGIYGTLWRCQDCPSSDLCSLCYSNDRHDISHEFVRIDTRQGPRQLLPKRKSSVKIRTIGLHPGAKVVRGKDWEWGDQDGGRESEGEVQGRDDAPGALRSMVHVRWANGETFSYRLGKGGKVDVTCVEEEVGPFYYRDHLPLLDTTVVKDPTQTVTSQTALEASEASPIERNFNGAANTSQERQGCTADGMDTEELTEGDRVAIKVDEDELQELQKGCGGCTARMFQCIGRTGEVTEIAATGVVSVKFGIKYRFNPMVLLKIPACFSENDVVRVRDDVKLLKLLNCRVGWKSAMEKTAGKVGRVARVDDDGNIRVDFHGVQYFFAPASCLPVTDGATPQDTLPSPPGSLAAGAHGNSQIPNIDDRQACENVAMFRQIRDLVQGQGQNVQGHSVRALFAAIQLGDADHVRRICEDDPSMVEREHDGITPLICASLRGKHQCAVTLMDLGADPNTSARGDFKKTPLSAVAEGKSEEMAELLLARGANAEYQYGSGTTLAHLCVVRNKPVIMKALAAHGANLDALDCDRHTPLYMAIKARRDEVTEVLAAAPQVNIHLRSQRGFDMIQLAAFENNSRALERLLARDSSRVDQGDSTALHIAAINGFADCVRLLVLQGSANVDARQAGSRSTPLMLAAHKAKLEAVEALLEMGADVNLSDRDADTAFHLAIGGKVKGYGKSAEAELTVAYRVQIANLLISSGAYVDAVNHQGRTALTYGVPEVRKGVKAFIRHNGDVVRQKPEGADSVLQSLGLSSLESHGPGQLKEVLKGVQLPCGVCGASKSDITLRPCAHCCVCRACSVKVTHCPLCDEEVKDKEICGD
ncbi:E3 ubiquitin-protein ligase MIB2-like isoform X2 [Babylonia areolata]|uniref:E3 ubiquitin-protein ligase MIB2-like isoform X2 n=1 Tax=Babylonia areolata TaxID=304850 RepID=UPI003FCF2E8C